MRGERGFALIAGLWLVVAITAVGVELSLMLRGQRAVAINAVEAARTRPAAAAGLEQAHARLARSKAAASEASADGESAGPWALPAGLLTDTMRLGDVSYRVTFRDVGSVVNLNAADEGELRRLLLALRVDAGRADRLAQAMLDWRDPDDDRRARGAEAADYLRDEAPALPANRPFRDVEELRFVSGMDGALMDRLRPIVTLLGSGRVNLNSAPPEVLMSLEGFSRESVAAIGALRRRGVLLRSLDQLAEELPPTARGALREAIPELRPRVTFGSDEVEAVSEAWTSDGATRSRAVGLFEFAANTVFPTWRRVS